MNNPKYFQKAGDIRRKQRVAAVERLMKRGLKPRAAVTAVSVENGLNDAEHAKLMAQFDRPAHG